MNLLTKGSENHCRNQLRKTLKEHVADIRETIKYANSRNVNVNVYLEDWSNGYQNSPQYVFQMMDALKDEGINHFMLPDTLGVLSPDQVYTMLKDIFLKLLMRFFFISCFFWWIAAVLQLIDFH